MRQQAEHLKPLEIVNLSAAKPASSSLPTISKLRADAPTFLPRQVGFRVGAELPHQALTQPRSLLEILSNLLMCTWHPIPENVHRLQDEEMAVIEMWAPGPLQRFVRDYQQANLQGWYLDNQRPDADTMHDWWNQAQQILDSHHSNHGYGTGTVRDNASAVYGNVVYNNYHVPRDRRSQASYFTYGARTPDMRYRPGLPTSAPPVLFERQRPLHLASRFGGL